ncbi:MAG: SixA phosphatase family protein, partial [Streptosporangiaceae bacterium]
AGLVGADAAGQGAPPGGVALSYERDVETVAAALAGPRRTTPLIVVRHASAGRKSDWSGNDLSRPLDRRGERDAWSLTSLLRCFGVSRVISAPAERCQATVRPYAAAIRAEVEVEPAFDVTRMDGGGAQRGVSADAERAAAALAAADEPVIICAHRENLPVLLAAACAVLGAQPLAGSPLHKGEFLVLHRAAATLIAAERYHPDGH